MKQIVTTAHFLYTRTAGLVLTFFAFVLIQIVFGAFYYWLFRRNQNNFTFNADILKSQTDLVRAETDAKVAALAQAKDVLAELGVELDLGVEPVQKPKNAGATVTLPSGCVADMHFSVAVSSSGGLPGFASHFSLLDPHRRLLFASQAPPASELVDWRRTSGQWSEVMLHFQTEITNELRTARMRQSALKVTSRNVWSYWDFLYFSTIVQTTVGFGDILPNSTPVRMLVTCQIIIGYALLVVILNMVLS